jgi:hypothetical protein
LPALRTGPCDGSSSVTKSFGYNGLFDQRRGKRSVHRVSLETAEKVLALYQKKYFDLNVRHFQEKLREEEQIELSYTWLYQALVGAGLVQKTAEARAAPAAAGATAIAWNVAAHRRQQASLAKR